MTVPDSSLTIGWNAISMEFASRTRVTSKVTPPLARFIVGHSIVKVPHRSGPGEPRAGAWPGGAENTPAFRVYDPRRGSLGELTCLQVHFGKEVATGDHSATHQAPP